MLLAAKAALATCFRMFFSPRPSIFSVYKMKLHDLLKHRQTFFQFICFAGVGAVGTVVHYSALIVAVQFLLVSPVPASVIGFILGGIVNYYLNYRITFKSNKKHYETFSKFFSIAFVGLLINTALMTLFVEIFNWYYLISQIITTGLVLIWNFAGNKLWTFKEKQEHITREVE